MPPHLMEGPEGFLDWAFCSSTRHRFSTAVGASRIVNSPTRQNFTTFGHFRLAAGTVRIKHHDLTGSAILRSFVIAIATLEDPRNCVYIWHSHVCIAHFCTGPRFSTQPWSTKSEVKELVLAQWSSSDVVHRRGPSPADAAHPS